MKSTDIEVTVAATTVSSVGITPTTNIKCYKHGILVTVRMAQAEAYLRCKELPKSFTMRFEEVLSDHAIIKVPNVFRYDGNSKFKAHIFGMDATEVEYPSHVDNPSHEVEMISTWDEVEVIPVHSGKVEVTSIRSGNTQSNDDRFMSSADRLNQKVKPATHKFPQKSQQQYTFSRKLNPKMSHYTKAFRATLAATEEFVSENPNFKVVMQPSYIRGGYVKVPMFFASSHLTDVTQKVVILRVSDGRTWEVGYVSRTRNNRGLSRGWYKFVSDNHLKESDVCVFELVDRKKFEMNVHIFRVLQDGI
ncbi:B3 domain-containing transcription factor VRN1-like [Papaver somniferum]|uniref:B3 domain-containing transcription factor VRN1-like n=1 Tax=Papaver somniferum TaxID=3469 RepID=UPI000E6FAC4B|nr:B3 domain-containing transcription factor VRN1-like [Papaver somniferum]